MIETMPTYLGEQFYLGGLPLPADKILYKSVSIQDRFIRKGTGTHDLKEDEKLCTDYMLYYLLAPCWQISEEDKERAMKADYDELWDICLDNGIDPF
jgi:hypothetical protein